MFVSVPVSVRIPELVRYLMFQMILMFSALTEERGMVTEKLMPPPSARVTGASFADCCVSSEVLAEFPSEFMGADIFGFVSVLASFAGAASILSRAADTALQDWCLQKKGHPV